MPESGFLFLISLTASWISSGSLLESGSLLLSLRSRGWEPTRSPMMSGPESMAEGAGAYREGRAGAVVGAGAAFMLCAAMITAAGAPPLAKQLMSA